MSPAITADGSIWEPLVQSDFTMLYEQVDEHLTATVFEDTHDVDFSMEEAGGGYLGLPFATPNGNNAQIPDSAALSVSGDIDIRWYGRLDQWGLGGGTILVAKWLSPERSYMLRHDGGGGGGRLTVFWSNTGTDSQAEGSFVGLGTDPSGPEFADNTFHWVRVTLSDADDKARFYYGEDGINWTQLGPDEPHTFSGINVGTQDVFIAAEHASLTYFQDVRRVVIYDGIKEEGGTLVLDANFRNHVEGTTSFTESSPEAATVTINTSGNDKIAFIHGSAWSLRESDYNDPVQDDLSMNQALVADGSIWEPSVQSGLTILGQSIVEGVFNASVQSDLTMNAAKIAGLVYDDAVTSDFEFDYGAGDTLLFDQFIATDIPAFGGGEPFSLVLTDRVTGILYDIDRYASNAVWIRPYTFQRGEPKYSHESYRPFNEPHINPPGIRVYIENGAFRFEKIINDGSHYDPINNPVTSREHIYELGVPDDFDINDQLSPLIWKRILELA